MEILDKICNAPGGSHILLTFDSVEMCEHVRVKMAKKLCEYPGVNIQRVRTKNHYNIKVSKEE